MAGVSLTIGWGGVEAMLPQGTRPHKKPPVPGSFGAAVRALREEKGLSQVQLGERSGLGQNGISRIETGDVKRPQEETVIKLSQGLGITPNEIWIRTSFPELSWQTDALRGELKTLSVEQQTVITYLARFLRENADLVRDHDPEAITAALAQVITTLPERGTCGH
jgi:transcriptional regulator with XRE-family HTH domain